jgi:hypothetical protein
MRAEGTLECGGLAWRERQDLPPLDFNSPQIGRLQRA